MWWDKLLRTSTWSVHWYPGRRQLLPLLANKASSLRIDYWMDVTHTLWTMLPWVNID